MIDRKHRGARSELIASTYLLDQGYEVFRNVSSHGLGDLVGWQGGHFTLFDVKTSADNRRLTLAPEQVAAGVKRLNVYPDGSCEIVEASPSSNIIQPCAGCSREFRPRNAANVFCGPKCLGQDKRNRRRATKIALGIEIRKGRPRKNRKPPFLEPARRGEISGVPE